MNIIKRKAQHYGDTRRKLCTVNCYAEHAFILIIFLHQGALKAFANIVSRQPGFIEKWKDGIEGEQDAGGEQNYDWLKSRT
jgi:hypothetical protein